LTFQAQLDGLILQLLNGACKADKLVRAVDLAMRLHLERSYDIAIQLAQRAQSTKLAQRIHILKRAKFGELAIDSEEEEDEQEAAKKRRLAEEEQELDLESLLTAPSDQNQPAKKSRRRRKKAEAVPSANGYAVGQKRRRKATDSQSKIGFAVDTDASQKKKSKKSGPKRAMSAYMLFCKDHRAALQDQGVAFKDIGAMLGKQWREIDVRTKKKYTELAKEDRDRYKRETRAAQRQEARDMMKATGNTRSRGSGSDEEALKPASIFAKKSKKVNKDTAKPKKEKSNSVNPFSINTASQVKAKPGIKTNPFAIKSEGANVTPRKHKTNPFAVNSKETNSTPQNNGRDEQGHATPDTATRKLNRPLLKRNTSFAKEARDKVSSKFIIDSGNDK
jgi:hypothetical protein